MEDLTILISLSTQALLLLRMIDRKLSLQRLKSTDEATV